MNFYQPLVMGIDLGTQGVRCLVSTLEGQVVGAGKIDICQGSRQGACFEQIPADWWEKTLQAIQSTLSHLKSNGYSPRAIQALSCDSTSGTVVAVDAKGSPLYPALMYNDARARAEADYINSEASSFTEKTGYVFDPSFALCKVLWLKRNQKKVFDSARYFIHAGDYITAQFTGLWGISDTSNSLKMGFDLLDGCWPSFIENTLGIPRNKLPVVIDSGQPVETIQSGLARILGLSPDTLVVAGATDGTASFYASGARQPGDVSASLGTTLVVRSVSQSLVKDPLGRVYCHRHPTGYWLPGGASNTGGNILNHLFPGENYRELDQRIAQLQRPTSLIIYPLTGSGERLPFAHPEATFFQSGNEKSREELYAACLEGVGYVERYSYDLLAELGSTPIRQVFTSGSGSGSSIWCAVRSSILDLPLIVPQSTESAMGACIMAAASLTGGLQEAGRMMVQIKREIEPDPALSLAYQEKYQFFLEECRKKGYLKKER